ncbi:MAG: prolipoprotein diacylglyceryl transferase [Candidatus Pacebacteria bacterium]|nr:prolipoprotein diacylglyceryl transferase [Candidatus Paceibacterota bacterium]
MFPALLFPVIDPIAVSVGPFAIRWYALAYIAGILLGWFYAVRLSRRSPLLVPRASLDDFVLYAVLGVIIGGRLGYVVFYQPEYFIVHPMAIFQLWQGGMSFHGGMLGVVLAIVVFAWRRKIPILAFGDVIAAVAPIGLFLGRVANFVNGELWGRTSTAPWAMVFPGAGVEPRHPSQLYQAMMEGILLFIILWLAERQGWRRRPGMMMGLFLMGYGLFRSLGEFFREPDSFKGFLTLGLTMGQWLSLPMILVGVYLMVRAARGRQYGQ